MRDRSEIKKFIADQEERHTGKRPEYDGLIRISDATHYFQMLEAKPLNIDSVVGSTDKEGTVLRETEPCPSCGKPCVGRACHDCQRYW